MTSKEALKNRIQTLRVNHKIGSRDIANQEILDIALFLENYVLKDLERLEELEISNKEIEELYLTENKHWCETIDSLRKENEKLKNENQILKMSVKDTYDTGQEITYELEQQNEKLKKALDVFAKHLQIEWGLQESWLQFRNGDDQSDDLEPEEHKLLKEVSENKL
jgi:hypothetical protein